MPTLVHVQPAKLSDTHAPPISWLDRGTRGQQPWWSVHKERSICYPYSRYPLQAQAPLNLSVMACHSLERTQADPLCLSENLISYDIVIIFQQTDFKIQPI